MALPASVQFDDEPSPTLPASVQFDALPESVRFDEPGKISPTISYLRLLRAGIKPQDIPPEIYSGIKAEQETATETPSVLRNVGARILQGIDVPIEEAGLLAMRGTPGGVGTGLGKLTASALKKINAPNLAGIFRRAPKIIKPEVTAGEVEGIAPKTLEVQPEVIGKPAASNLPPDVIPIAEEFQGIKSNIPSEEQFPLTSGIVKAQSEAEKNLDKVGNLFESKVSLEKTGQVAESAKDAVEALANTQASAEKQRLYKQVAEALGNGEISVPDLPEVLKGNKIGLKEFVEHYKDTIATSARQLNQLSQLRQYLDRLHLTDPDALAALKILEKAPQPDGLWNRFIYGYKAWPGYVKIDNVRRASLVSQMATSMRNFWSQVGSYSLYTLDQGLQGLQLGKGLGNSVQDTISFFSHLNPLTRTKTLETVNKVLSSFPLDSAKLLSEPAAESVLGKYTKFINTLNTLQENFFRRTTFDASLRSQIANAGMDVATTLSNPKNIPESFIRKAVNDALYVTFARTPSKGTFGYALTQAYKDLPILTTIQPFPRFLANSMKFLIDYNPSGILRLMGKDLQGQLNYLNPQLRAEILSKASIGTALLASGITVRSLPVAGKKWYQIKSGDKTYDMRAFAPLSTYLFLGEILRTMADAGKESFRTNESFLKTLKSRSGMTIADVVQGIISINRIAGTGLVAIELLQQGAAEQQIKSIKDFIAQYIGGFTVPFKTIKDIAAGIATKIPSGAFNDYGEEESKLRDVRDSIFSPILNNIPIASQFLPEARSAIRKEPLRSETPLLRQVSGISGSRTDLVTDEVNRLGVEPQRIYPRTGHPISDREAAKIMQPLVQRILPRLIASQGYQDLPRIEQKLTIIKIIQAIRTNAIKGSFPALPKKIQDEVITGKFGPEVRQIIEELP